MSHLTTITSGELDFLITFEYRKGARATYTEPADGDKLEILSVTLDIAGTQINFLDFLDFLINENLIEDWALNILENLDRHLPENPRADYDNGDSFGVSLGEA